MNYRTNVDRGLRAALIAALLFVATAGLAGAADEQVQPPPAAPKAQADMPDKFMLRLGGYHVRGAENLLRLDADNAPVGAYIDFAETLGGESTGTVGRLDGLYRFNDKHAMGFAWYALRFEGNKTLGRLISWGTITIDASTPVKSKLDYDILKVNYQYSLAHTDKVELGVLAGFHVLWVDFSIDATVVSGTHSTAITAPMPVLGIVARYHFTPLFTAYYNYEIFGVDVENKISGGMQDMLVGAEYRVAKNIGLGAAYNKFSLNMAFKKPSSTLHVDANWYGLMLYGAVYF